MLKIYRTKEQQLTRETTFAEGCWICMTAPNPDEIRRVATTLAIEPADLQAALDAEESARISLEDGYTLIPLRVYFKDRRVKIALGLCRGKKNYDKRAAAASRDAKRNMDRAVRDFNRRG